MHEMPVSKVWAQWAEAGALGQAFLASVTPRAAEQHRDLSVRHGDGTHTMAHKGVLGWARRAPNTSRARQASHS